MQKILMRASAMVVLLGLTGCASDPVEVSVSKAIGQLEQAAATMEGIKESVNTTVKKTEAAKLKADSFSDALAKVEELKGVGIEMQRIRAETETLSERVSEQERQELVKEYDGRLQSAILRVREARNQLDEAIQKAEKVSERAVAPLKAKLSEAIGTFESLAKQG